MRMNNTPGTTRYLPPILLAIYTLVWIVAAINPWYPHDWMLENLLVVLALPTVIIVHRHGSLSDGAWIAMFLFFVLHAIGAHYTYSEVPYDAWWKTLTGVAFNDMVGWERNHFDRLVHFSYGLLLTPAFTEWLGRVVSTRSKTWMCVLVASFMGMQAMLYELIEWAAAMLVAPELGAAWLGTQGDIRDAHKDMALAVFGNLIALAWLLLRGQVSTIRSHIHQ